MEEWIEREVNAVIGVECDEVTNDLNPIIIIENESFSWKEFGEIIETFDGWQFNFKLSSISRR